MSIQHVQGALLFLVLAVNSNRFGVALVVHSYLHGLLYKK